MAQLTLLAAFASRPEAVVAQSLLRSEGIDTFMPDAHVTLTELDPSMMTGWRLLIDADLVEDALAVLRDAQMMG